MSMHKLIKNKHGQKQQQRQMERWGSFTFVGHITYQNPAFLRKRGDLTDYAVVVIVHRFCSDPPSAPLAPAGRQQGGKQQTNLWTLYHLSKPATEVVRLLYISDKTQQTDCVLLPVFGRGRSRWTAEPTHTLRFWSCCVNYYRWCTGQVASSTSSVIEYFNGRQVGVRPRLNMERLWRLTDLQLLSVGVRAIQKSSQYHKTDHQ